MKLQVNLNQKSINHAIGELKKYKDELYFKTERLMERLIDEGIRVAEMNKGFYGMYIVFEKELIGGDNKCVGILIGRNRSSMSATWDYYGSVKSAEISPILFAEFGSGWLSEVLFENVPMSQVGQGTFPGQTHAFDPGGWSYKTLDGQWHHSVGFKPTHPMYKAELAILEKVEEIAREVFANGI